MALLLSIFHASSSVFIARNPYICSIVRKSNEVLRHLLLYIIIGMGLLGEAFVMPVRGMILPATDAARHSLADSIMQQVIFYAPLYESIVDRYDASLYIKGRVHIPKKNRLIRFIPSMFRLRKGVTEYLTETHSDLHFTAPDIYDQKVKASIGTASEFWMMDGRLPEYFHINIYSTTLLYDKLLSPLASNAMKYYEYRLDSVVGASHNQRFYIHFTPKSKSFQLVDGYLVVSDNVWSVREINFSGRSELFRYNNRVQMGEVDSDDEFLPVFYELDGRFKLLGNVLEGSYTAVLDYHDIHHRSIMTEQLRWSEGKSKYDLSDSFRLTCDTNTSRRDTAYFNAIRPIPLTHREDSLYEDFFLKRDTLFNKRKPRSKQLEFWGQLGDALVSRYTIELADLGSVRCSPLINPLLLSYSKSNGFSYRQEFKYNRLFAGDRLLRIVPKVGYNFKRKEFYWSVVSDFEYWPSKRASLHLNIGNGNRIYSSDILDELKAMPDSIFDFNKIHLDYFKDLYFHLYHSWEIVNGLTLDVGLSMHRRTEAERSQFVLVNPDRPAVRTINPSPESPGYDMDLLKKFRHTYISFAPRVRLSWTPGMYYYMNGKRKVNLYSQYPTFSIDWERGVKGIMKSTGKYERIELDVQHQIPLGLMRNLYYRVGGGIFTDQEELYFVDFVNFTRSNLPVGWNDEIGGVFQLLDRRWYNSSREYLRGHVTYEAPFLLMRHLKKYTQYVLNERLYFNLLLMPHLMPYAEFGYGIGTHIFDFGVFASFANWGYREIGCKFTFELFNR